RVARAQTRRLESVRAASRQQTVPNRLTDFSRKNRFKTVLAGVSRASDPQLTRVELNLCNLVLLQLGHFVDPRARPRGPGKDLINELRHSRALNGNRPEQAGGILQCDCRAVARRGQPGSEPGNVVLDPRRIDD